jgi:hypothetical protein
MNCNTDRLYFHKAKRFIYAFKKPIHRISIESPQMIVPIERAEADRTRNEVRSRVFVKWHTDDDILGSNSRQFVEYRPK